MFDLISPKEQQLIREYITVFGPIGEEQDDNKPMAPLETIFSTWEKEKKTLFKLLGN